uniref:NADH-ubiquinone oxidoreductase chain 2 n=1 Tax=Caligus rogercresseyi TaxID=217165 RepID=E1B2P6_CALRO|nr:NADH dehydrogenase subunit 2 [Caligus rogercresseyi]
MHNKMLLMLGLSLSVVAGLSSSGVVTFWSMLELNTMFFIGVLWSEKLESHNVSSMKYFLVQGLGSIFMLLGVFSGVSVLLIIGFPMKLGVFPFYFWSLDLVVSSSWLVFFLMMTVQKLLPVVFIGNIVGMGSMVYTLFLLGMVTSCLGSFYKSDLKSIMFYSSLFNLSLLLLLMSAPSLMFSCFLIYCLVLFPCWVELKHEGVSNIQQLKMSKGKSWMFMSLGGFPPSLGLIFKWLIFKNLFTLGFSVYILGSAILMSLFMFYLYINIILMMASNKLVSFWGFHSSAQSGGLYLQLGLVSVGATLMYSFTKSILKMGMGVNSKLFG